MFGALTGFLHGLRERVIQQTGDLETIVRLDVDQATTWGTLKLVIITKGIYQPFTIDVYDDQKSPDEIITFCLQELAKH